jgi:hypothetical protein
LTRGDCSFPKPFAHLCFSLAQDCPIDKQNGRLKAVKERSVYICHFNCPKKLDLLASVDSLGEMHLVTQERKSTLVDDTKCNKQESIYYRHTKYRNLNYRDISW